MIRRRRLPTLALAGLVLSAVAGETDVFPGIRAYALSRSTEGIVSLMDEKRDATLRLVLTGTATEKTRPMKDGGSRALVLMESLGDRRPYVAEFLISSDRRTVVPGRVRECHATASRGTDGDDFFNIEIDELLSLRESVGAYYDGVDRAFSAADSDALAARYSDSMTSPMRRSEAAELGRTFLRENAPVRSRSSLQIISLSRCSAEVLVEFRIKAERTGAVYSGIEKDWLMRAGGRWLISSWKSQKAVTVSLTEISTGTSIR